MIFQPMDAVWYERVTSTKPFKSMLISANVTHISPQRIGIRIITPTGIVDKMVKAKYLRKINVRRPK